MVKRQDDVHKAERKHSSVLERGSVAKGGNFKVCVFLLCIVKLHRGLQVLDPV